MGVLFFIGFFALVMANNPSVPPAPSQPAADMTVNTQ